MAIAESVRCTNLNFPVNLSDRRRFRIAPPPADAGRFLASPNGTVRPVEQSPGPHPGLHDSTGTDLGDRPQRNYFISGRLFRLYRYLACCALDLLPVRPSLPHRGNLLYSRSGARVFSLNSIVTSVRACVQPVLVCLLHLPTAHGAPLSLANIATGVSPPARVYCSL